MVLLNNSLSICDPAIWEPAISKVWSIRPRSFQLPLRLKQIIGNLLPELNS
nr:MAG TPA: hypothetical protein [Caudoviricetes sp.]